MIDRIGEIKTWLTYSQKDGLIRASITAGVSPNSIMALALKELLAKGTDYIKDALVDEDLRADELIKKRKEDLIP